MTGMPPTLADVVAALPRSAAGVRVEHLVTSGTFSLDGGTWDVDNNVWILGDDTQCVVIDAPHDAGPILAAIGDRRLLAVLCTHAHDDHVTAALEVCGATGATAYLHPADRVLWDRVHASAPDHDLADGDVLQVGDVEVQVLHTPGHAPGACCFLVPALGVLFSGDTLFNGGPGATGRSFSDRPTILRSIADRLLALPPDTVVHTGHGDDTTIGAEAPGVRAELDQTA